MIPYVILLLLIKLSEPVLIIVLVLLSHCESEVPVLSQVFLLSAFPYRSEVLGGLEHEASLLLSELSILSERVEAYDILAVFGEEGLLLDWLPLALLNNIELPVLLLFFLDLLLVLIPLLLRFILLF